MTGASGEPVSQPPAGGPARILVIKHGALGDFVLATGPFQAIRKHHEGARITLLTTAPFAEMAGECGWFDDVWVDRRPKAWNLPGVLGLRKRLRRGAFERVYDLQTSDRSSSYFRLFASPRPEWSGIAPGCSHPHANPGRDAMHTIERQAEQLDMAGIADVPPPDVSWLVAPLRRFGLPVRFVLLVPGGAAHRPEKRWPAERYAELAGNLANEGLVPVLIGTAAEADVLAEIAGACPAARNLCGETSLAEIASLARRAAGALGNDTGPMHLIAAADCPSLVLFSNASDPAITAPRGASVELLHEADLAALDVSRVRAALRLR